MTTHMMVDLETLGVVPGSAILSIGAVVWHENIGTVATLHVRVELLSCLLEGMTINPDTVRWWREQALGNPSALDSLRAEPPVPLEEALQALSDLWVNSGAETLWGNGAAADPVWLEDAYHRCGIQVPWRYSQVRCYRTAMAISGIPREEWVKPDIEHDAFQDAYAQMKNLRVALLKLGPWREAGQAAAAGDPMDTLRMDWLEGSPSIEVSRENADASDPSSPMMRVISRVSGPVNDREWTRIGQAPKLREAVDRAMKDTSVPNVNLGEF